MTVSMHKTLAALKLPRRVGALRHVAEAILVAMNDNPAFPAPTPTLAAVATAISELRDAEVATQTRTRGTTAVRDVKRAVLVNLLMRLKAYVQGVADEDPEHAAALIESTGMMVKRRVTQNKVPFDVRQGPVSGAVRLAVRSAGDRASYQWAWSINGGAKWEAAPATLQAKTVISGLTPGATVSFRYRAVTVAGEGDWSEAVALVVK